MSSCVLYTSGMGALENILARKPKKYLIFDFDETLFVLNMPWRKYKREIRKKLEALESDSPRIDGLSNLENQMTIKWGLTAAKIRWEYSSYFEETYFRGARELTDLTDFIRTHHDEYTFYLWTSNMRATVEMVLQKSDLLQYFTQLVTKEDVMLMKPFAEGFEKLYDPKTQKKYEFLMIGNSRDDKQAAAAAGIDYWMRP